MTEAESRMEDFFAFVEAVYVNQAGAHGAFTPEERSDIVGIRVHYPELATWGDQAVFHAWQAYSQNAYMTGWREDVSEDEDGREEFLDFLCWEQTRGEFPWGADRDQLKSVRPIWRHTAS